MTTMISSFLIKEVLQRIRNHHDTGSNRTGSVPAQPSVLMFSFQPTATFKKPDPQTPKPAGSYAQTDPIQTSTSRSPD